MRKAENLKNTLRSAHTSNARHESSAEHSWRLCLLVLVIGRFFEGIAVNKLLRPAVIHDLGEAVSGDIPAKGYGWMLKAADEPASDLYVDTAAEIMGLLLRANLQGKALLIVTHDLEITWFSSRVYRLDSAKLQDSENAAA